MTVIRMLLVMASVFTICSAQAETLTHIKETGVLHLCANPQQKPYSWRGDKPEGFQVDLAQALADKLDVQLEVSWIFLKRHAKETGCDLYAGVPLLEGDTKYVKKSEPFTRIEFKLLTRKDSQAINSLADLTGKTVGVTSGSVAAHKLREHGIQLAVSQRDEAKRLEALAEGVIDAAIVSNLSVGWYKQTFGDRFTVYDAEDALGVSLNYEYSLGLRRSDQVTKDGFNQLLRQMESDGSMSTLLAKYGL